MQLESWEWRSDIEHSRREPKAHYFLSTVVQFYIYLHDYLINICLHKEQTYP